MQLSTLVLPAPFGPISANNSPALDRERNAVEHHEAAEPQREVFDRRAQPYHLRERRYCLTSR